MPLPVPFSYFVGPVLTGFVQPGLGAGEATFYPDPYDHGMGYVKFLFKANVPWTQTGVQPFAWDMMPSTSERPYPIIRLILARHVMLETKVFRGVHDGAPLKLYGIALGPKSPYVMIVRTQDIALVPQPGDRIDITRIIGAPRILGPGSNFPEDATFGPPNSGLNPTLQVVVQPRPSGLTIHNPMGFFAVRVTVPEYEQSGFIYDIMTPEKKGDLWQIIVRIVHTSNVKIEAVVDHAYRAMFLLEVKNLTAKRVALPAQGSELPHTLPAFAIKMTNVPKPFNWKRAIFELALSLFSPIFAIVYDIGHLVYANITGKTFYGEEADDQELIMLAIACVLPLAIRVPRQLTALQRELSKSPLGRALQGGTLAEVVRSADDDFIKAVGAMDSRSAARIGKLLSQYVAGTKPALEVLREFNAIVADGYLTRIAGRAVERVMTSDLTSFRNVKLAANYTRYVTKGGKKSPIEWLLSQRGKSSNIAEIAAELGGNWRETLRYALRSDVRFAPMSEAAIKHYDKLAGRVLTYKALAKANSGHGGLFEVDHVLEQRFWRNDPRVTSAFDEAGEGMAVLVPKNPAVAHAMMEQGKSLAYVHTTKTRMMDNLIPKGTEAQFSVQQIYDAHMFVLESLKVDRSIIYGDRVTHMFQMLARTRREKLLVRVAPHPSTFEVMHGWPVPIGVLPPSNVGPSLP